MIQILTITIWVYIILFAFYLRFTTANLFFNHVYEHVKIKNNYYDAFSKLDIVKKHYTFSFRRIIMTILFPLSEIIFLLIPLKRRYTDTSSDGYTIYYYITSDSDYFIEKTNNIVILSFMFNAFCYIPIIFLLNP